jgi:hypothetical protein
LPFRARACRPASLLLAAGVTLLGGIVPARRAAAFGAMPEAITSYKIRVRYEPGSHEYTGQAQVSWINTAPEPVPDLQLHLYPNAFKNAASTYLRESENAERLTRLLAGRWAWLDITKLRLESGADLTDRVRFIAPDDGNADDRTVARVELPRPAAPGELVRFTVEFHGRMPPVVDRGGWAKDFVMAAQWYPKLGVYEAAGRRGRVTGGWNCHQFHSKSEFFSDFGDYEVTITLPGTWKTGGTGSRVWRHENQDGTATERWARRGVHDFAWTASPRFDVVERTFEARKEVSEAELEAVARTLGREVEDVRLPDVKVRLLAFPEERRATERNLRALFTAIKFYGLWYGPYPYDSFTLLVPPRAAEIAGGMEYPAFVLGFRSFGYLRRYGWLEGTLVHEFGHQYWYGMVASNEFEESWLDEGLDTYSEAEAMGRLQPRISRFYRVLGVPVPGVEWHDLGGPGAPLFGIFGRSVWYGYWGYVRRLFLAEPATDAVVRNAWDYWSEGVYTVNSYQRPAMILKTLERLVGTPAWPRVLRTYAENYRFKHPTTRDFLATLNSVTGQDWSSFFDQFVWGQRRVDYEVATISSDAIEGLPGIYERDGKRVTVTARDLERERERREKATRKDKASKQAALDTTRYRSEVRVRRLGDGIVPVEVRVYFSDSTSVRENWDGRYPWAKFTYTRPARVDSVAVDPDGKVLIDVNRLNNVRAAQANRQPAQRWTLHWLLWVQSFLQLVGWVA